MRGQIKTKMNPQAKQLAKVLAYYGLYQPDVSMKQKIVCPFHNDINASMLIDYSDGRFFCFGCHVSGDAFHFVKLMEPDKPTFKRLSYILNTKKVNKIDLSGRVKIVEEDKKKATRYAKYFYNGLKQIDWETDEQDEAIHCREYMRDRGFSAKTLNKVKAKITYIDNYPIIFPMYDNDIFKGYVMRTTDKIIEKQRKYLYNEGFSRATTLVGDYGDDDVILVEGYMDRLRFIQNGYDNAVAILGWKMSGNQIMKLQESNPGTIISALDNDQCGKDGYKWIRQHFEDVRLLAYPSKPMIKDPGDMKEEIMDQSIYKTYRR